ncbi:MAG: hypothetical protein ING19_07220 [Azospirillum sp.]|nr:hypothetical protein [Azospirillum sp.]
MLLEGLTLAAALALCVWLRIRPRLALPNALFSDTYFHLYVARVLEEGRLRLPERLPRIVLRHEHTYPPLYHVALATLPSRWRSVAERVTGAAADCAIVLVAYVAVRGWMVGDPRAHVAALFVAFGLVLAPAFLRIGSGPRAYNGSPRPVGQALFVLYAIAAHAWVADGHPILLLAGALATAGVILSSKFSLQVLAFFSVAFAVCVSPLHAVPPFAGFALAFVAAPYRTAMTLRGHFRHSLFYVRDLQHIFLHPNERSFMAYIRGAIGQLVGALASRSARALIDWLFAERQGLHMLLVAFLPCVAAPLLALTRAELAFQERFALVWVGVALACFVLTRIRSLLFLGEAERYLEYALVPALWLCVAWLLPDHTPVLIAYLVFCAAAAAHFQSAYRRAYAGLDQRTRSTEKLFDLLAERPSGCIMPIGSFHWQTLYRSRFPVLTIGVNVDSNVLPRDEFMLVYGRYPYPSPEFDQILDTYDVRYIVSDTVHIAHYTQKILASPEIFDRRVRLLAAEGGMVLYEVTT